MKFSSDAGNAMQQQFTPILLSLPGLMCEGFQRGAAVKQARTTEMSAAGQFVFDRIAMDGESRSNCRISATLGCATISPRTWSTVRWATRRVARVYCRIASGGELGLGSGRTQWI